MAVLQNDGTVDYGTDGVAILLALLKVAKPNATFNVPDDWEFLSPVALTGQDAIVTIVTNSDGSKTPIIRNTRIFLMPKAHTGSFGAQVLYYDRVNAATLGKINIPASSLDGTLQTLLTVINARTGYGISPEDIASWVVSQPDANGLVTVNLSFVPTSLMFYSGAEITAQDYIQYVTSPGAGSLGIEPAVNWRFTVSPADAGSSANIYPGMDFASLSGCDMLVYNSEYGVSQNATEYAKLQTPVTSVSAPIVAEFTFTKPIQLDWLSYGGTPGANWFSPLGDVPRTFSSDGTFTSPQPDANSATVSFTKATMLPVSKVKLEYSKDGGVTWIEAITKWSEKLDEEMFLSGLERNWVSSLTGSQPYMFDDYLIALSTNLEAVGGTQPPVITGVVFEPNELNNTVHTNKPQMLYGLLTSYGLPFWNHNGIFEDPPYNPEDGKLPSPASQACSTYITPAPLTGLSEYGKDMCKALQDTPVTLSDSFKQSYFGYPQTNGVTPSQPTFFVRYVDLIDTIS